MEPARQHHMIMKYQLARMAIQDPARFLATFGPEGDSGYLFDLWTAIGEKCPPTERVASSGLSTSHQTREHGSETLVIIFPPPVRRNEAHFLAIPRLASGQCRVFALERSAPSSEGAETALLAEFAPNARSVWHMGATKNIADLVSQIDAIISNPSAAPLTFIPIQLA